MRAIAAAVLLLAAAGGQRPAIHQTVPASRRDLILKIEDGRNPTPVELQQLIDLARSGEDRTIGTDTAALAIRALGRLERRELVSVLLTLVRDSTLRGPAALALLVTLRAYAREADPDIDAAVGTLLRVTDSATVLAHLPYRTTSQVEAAETKLLARADDPKSYAAVAGGFEVLARRHRRLHQLTPSTIDFLTRGATRSLPAMDPEDDGTPRMALAALTSAGVASSSVISETLRDRDEHVRRLAVAALNAGSSLIDTSVRATLLRDAWRDSSHFVRYEVVRGWIRHGGAHDCRLLVDALGDSNLHVVLLALDALGERCITDEAMTDRLAAEVRTPPTVGEWQREAHALVALAKRSPHRAAVSMPAFIGHGVWQVRMYAARAAAAMNDQPSLERLASDTHHNVREAALAPLRRVRGQASDAAFVAALSGTDEQLLRTAAIALEGAGASTPLAAALAGALERLTKERKDTSRDTRLALIERLREVGGKEQLGVYERLLKDYDPAIAQSAAAACSALSSRTCVASPQLLPRDRPPTPDELSPRVRARVELESGGRFTIICHPDLAPLACARFLRLARAHYYDGLTFHRVEPSFVIQGGSPGANEYAGDRLFMRDELGGSHRRGTVGVSTRGRDTGDAQIFVNLVDNPRLDFEYTVFAHIPLDEMSVVDEVREGTRILRITVTRE